MNLPSNLCKMRMGNGSKITFILVILIAEDLRLPASARALDCATQLLRRLLIKHDGAFATEEGNQLWFTTLSGISSSDSLSLLAVCKFGMFSNMRQGVCAWCE